MANLNYIIEFSFSFCTKCCTYVWENVNLNTEIHCHFTYCIDILHITLQIEFCYTYASILFWVLIVVVPLLFMEGQRALRFHQNILNCVLKMNEGLTSLEQHEGE